eukprot:5457-Rhodomonas_salina.8
MQFVCRACVRSPHTCPRVRVWLIPVLLVCPAYISCFCISCLHHVPLTCPAYMCASRVCVPCLYVLLTCVRPAYMSGLYVCTRSRVALCGRSLDALERSTPRIRLRHTHPDEAASGTRQRPGEGCVNCAIDTSTGNGVTANGTRARNGAAAAPTGSRARVPVFTGWRARALFECLPHASDRGRRGEFGPRESVGRGQRQRRSGRVSERQ